MYLSEGRRKVKRQSLEPKHGDHATSIFIERENGSARELHGRRLLSLVVSSGVIIKLANRTWLEQTGDFTLLTFYTLERESCRLICTNDYVNKGRQQLIAVVITCKRNWEDNLGNEVDNAIGIWSGGLLLWVLSCVSACA